MSKAIIVFVLLAIAAVCFAKKDTVFDGFIQKLMTAVKSKLAQKAESLSDSDLKFVPCSRVCSSKPEDERKSCIKTCEANQAEKTRRWLNQNRLITKKNEAKKVEKALSDLRMIPCSTFCAKNKNTEECVEECKKRQAETTKWWNNMNQKNKTKKTASLSDLSFMPCSRVCKDRTDKDACNNTCRQQQADAMRRWNERNNRLREKFAKKTSAPTSVKPLSDADLSLIPCHLVCAKKDDKEKCTTECKEKNAKAAKWWSDMMKNMREKQKQNKNKVTPSSDLSLVPCSRICGANGSEACLNKCHEGQRKALARWAEMNKKIRSQFSKQPNALADSELRFVPCDRLCAKDENSKDKCIKTCQAKQRETTKKWLEMNKPKKEKKEKTLTFGDAELRFMPCSRVCDNKKNADATVNVPQCLKKCAEDQRKITQNWLNGPYCRKNCASDKVADCISQGRKVCPAKTA